MLNWKACASAPGSTCMAPAICCIMLPMLSAIAACAAALLSCCAICPAAAVIAAEPVYWLTAVSIAPEVIGAPPVLPLMPICCRICAIMAGSMFSSMEGSMPAGRSLTSKSGGSVGCEAAAT